MIEIFVFSPFALAIECQCLTRGVTTDTPSLEECCDYCGVAPGGGGVGFGGATQPCPDPLLEMAQRFRALFPKTQNVPELIGNILKTTLSLTGSIALLFFVYGGILWLTSGGSADKIKKAQTIMVWAVIGLFVIFASYAIVSTVITAVGG